MHSGSVVVVNGEDLGFTWKGKERMLLRDYSNSSRGTSWECKGLFTSYSISLYSSTNPDLNSLVWKEGCEPACSGSNGKTDNKKGNQTGFSSISGLTICGQYSSPCMHPVGENLFLGIGTSGLSALPLGYYMTRVKCNNSNMSSAARPSLPPWMRGADLPWRVNETGGPTRMTLSSSCT